jgi:hypothetical protein
MGLMNARRLMLTAVVSLCSLSGIVLVSAPVALAVTPPVVEEAWVSNVASSSATLAAQVNPEGSETTYRFEYGTSEVYSEKTPAPNGPVGSGSTSLTVQAHPQDLIPGTVYHFRVVLEGAGGTPVDGPDHTFTTQAVGSQISLLDGRQWELVSPAEKHGAEIFPKNGAVMQAAADGSAITYYMGSPFVGESAPANAMLSQALSKRGSSGWSTQDIATPNEQLALNDPAANSEEYMFFSEDLSHALVEPLTELPAKFAPDVSQMTLYVRDDSTGSYTAVMNDSNVAPGAEYTHHLKTSPERCEVPTETTFWDASLDLSHVVVNGCAGLTGETDGGALAPGTREDNLYYEWSADTGRLRLVTQLSSYPECAKDYGSVQIGSAEIGGHIMRNAVASDGSVFWDGEQGKSGNHVYVTEPDGSVVQVDQPQGVPGVTEPECYPSSSRFEDASNDGSLVFIQSGDLTSTPVQEALYAYEKGSGKLTLLTAPVNPSETSAGLLGTALGSSEDGSYLYFAAESVLTESENAEHQSAVAGQANLYVMHSEVHNGVREWSTSFIATLDKGDPAGEAGLGQSGDQMDWAPGDKLEYMTSRVSPDGRYVAFMSDRSLTGYDNHDASSGQPDEELYEYDATTGRLVCASCNPSGARPQGRMEPFHALTNVTTGRWAERWAAAAVPGWTQINKKESQSDRQPRYLSDTGRLFFDGIDPLVAHDINGTVDVYEFEPVGTGDCSSSSVTFSASNDGCVGLVSGGTGLEESVFVEASSSGEDAFFITGDRLAGEDVDNTFDMYDAHECSERVPCFPAGGVASPTCDNEASCRAAPSPQPSIFGSPSSATFAGAGNVKVTVSQVTPRKRVTRAQKLASALKACRRDRSARKRALCVKRAHAKYGSGPARNARRAGHTSRRAGR